MGLVIFKLPGNHDKITTVVRRIWRGGRLWFPHEGREVTIAATVLGKGARARSIRSFGVNRKSYARSSRGWKRGLCYSTRGFIAPLRIARKSRRVRARRTRNRGYVRSSDRKRRASALPVHRPSPRFLPSRQELAGKVLINAAINSCRIWAVTTSADD